MNEEIAYYILVGLIAFIVGFVISWILDEIKQDKEA